LTRFHELIVEKMQALHDVVKAGYVRYIGMSSCWAYQCRYLTPLRGQSNVHLLSSPCNAKSDRCDCCLSVTNSLTPNLQTMRSRTSLLLSSQCRTTTVSYTARRSAKCSPLSRCSYCNVVRTVAHRGEDVWRRLNSMVSIGSWCPHTPAWTADKQRPV